MPGDDRSILDGIAEIAVVADGQMRIDTVAGRTVFGPISLPASSGGGPLTVGDFDGNPALGGTLIYSQTTTRDLFPGDCEEVSWVWANAPKDDPHDVTVAADYDIQRTECVESNNKALITGVTCEGMEQ